MAILMLKYNININSSATRTHYMLFLNAFIVGFTAAALPGAVQTTVLQTALSGKWKEGIRLATGAAFMDGLLIFLAFVGLIQFIVNIDWLKFTIGIMGVFYMLLLGVSGFLKSIEKMPRNSSVINKRTFWNGALLVVLHPPTIFYFIGVAASLSTTILSSTQIILASLLLFFGAFACFLFVALLGLVIYKIKNKILLIIFHILTSLILIFFAIKLLYSLLF